MIAGDRFGQIQSLLKTQKIDALLLNHRANVSYAVGFNAPDAYALVTPEGIHLITDFRYAADYRRQALAAVTVTQPKKSFFDTIAQIAAKSRIRSLGFESRHLTFAECEILHELFGKKISFIPIKKSIEALREIKRPEELNRIRKALAITLEAYNFIEKKIKPDIAELALAGEIERFIRLKGARSSAFDIIVASGPNASYPHATASQRRLKNGEPVIIDMGVDYEGYKSDLTRTFFLGRIPPIVRKSADIVRLAQKKAIQAIKPGVLLKDIDAAARQFIASKGVGKNFGHALGHGVGLEVHEDPAINKKNDHPAKEGMVFTVEPGIYLEGDFGIRMEEMVAVTRDGVEVLSGNH